MKLITIFFVFCASSLFAQSKIDFRDGNSITLKGQLIGTYAKPDFFDASVIDKNIQTYFNMDGDTLEISIYSVYANNSFDDLKIYRIHKNQIDVDLDYFSVDEETDDNENVTHYSLSFSTIDEEKFKYKGFTIYSSIGKPQSFNTFTISSNEKDGLEELFNLLIN